LRREERRMIAHMESKAGRVHEAMDAETLAAVRG
jgi:hypothetical protein